MDAAETQPMLSAKQASEAMDCSPAHISAMIRDGRLTRVSHPSRPNRIFVPKNEIDWYLCLTNRTTAHAPPSSIAGCAFVQDRWREYGTRAGLITGLAIAPSGRVVPVKQLELPGPKEPRRPWGTGPEGVVERAVFSRLERAGKAPRAQVKVAAGIVDILTDEAIYEIKATLTRAATFQAMGQLIAYQTQLRKRRLIIVGRRGDGVGLIPHIEKAGFTVEIWEED